MYKGAGKRFYSSFTGFVYSPYMICVFLIGTLRMNRNDFEI